MEIISSIVILLAVVIVFANEVYQQKVGVSAMPTVPSIRKAMLSHVPAGTIGRVMELGSGWGGIAFGAARQHPGAQVTGVEYSLFPYLYSRLKLLLRPQANLNFVRGDFFALPMNDVNVVLCYLSNPHMARLEPKFKAELPMGARIISSTFHMPNWQPKAEQRVEGAWDTVIYIYEKESGI